LIVIDGGFVNASSIASNCSMKSHELQQTVPDACVSILLI